MTGFRKPSHFSIHKYIILPDVFVSYGCYKLLTNLRAQNNKRNSLPVLEARSPKSVSRDQNEGVGRAMFPPEVFGEKVFPVMCGSLKKASSLMCSCITPVSAFQTTLPPPLPFVLKSPSACS